jgi:chromosome partitioning protein
MAKIIGVIQVKGGAGRSTLATNLAGVMALKNKTLLIDCDMPQGTSASWYSIRKQAGKAGELALATAGNHQELVEQVKQHSDDQQLIIIDCPPRIAEITRAALILSDLCLIPLGASAPEIWATSDLLKTINEAKQIKPAVDARLVWNRFRSATSSAQELAAAVRTGLGLAEMKTKLGLRVAYSDALARGMTAIEWTDRAAKDEMAELAKETTQILKSR